MVRKLKLQSSMVQNTFNDVHPPLNNAYYGGWYDNSSNANHGVLNTVLYTFNSSAGWLGSYEVNDYYNLRFGANLSGLTVPTLYDVNFPQLEGTIHFIIKNVDWTSLTNCQLFGDYTNSTIFARVSQSGAEYGLQCGAIGSDGLYKALIEFSDAGNRLLLGAINKITMAYKTGVGGYFKLFINGVKIKQVNLTSTFLPTAQKFIIGKGGDKKSLYVCELDDTVESDVDIIAFHNTEWRIQPYSLPTLNKSYAAYGDSITWTEANGNNYPKLVHDYVKSTYGKMAYFNKGIGGITSADLVTNLNSFNYIGSDIITIGVGMNDCANQGISVANYIINLGLAIDFIRSRNASAKIILCTPSGTSDANRTPYIASYRTAMEAVATAKSCYLCKFHEAVTDANIGTYSSDGIHPNATGHVLLMGKLQPIIDEIL